MKLINKSMLTAIITLSTASVYYAQQVQDTASKSKDIEEVVLTGVADIAKDRKTPVAVSTIKAAQIAERLGNQELPEILNTTPSVYVTKGGGGFGDASIRVRGFGNSNIAVMINGIPVNDMENGAVYWSNWAGLSDVTSAIQMQRGLGSSKLAIASVGGTMNYITRAADMKRQGNVTVGLGNDGYLKTSFAYNTGKSAKGWSTSFLLGRTAGSMYFEGSEFEAYNYYFALGYQPNEKHDFQFTFTGAPQWHNQNFTNSIATFLDMGDGLLDGKKAADPNRRYNSNWGLLNGEEFSTNTNYYSKPIMSLNWDWKISEKSKLSTVGYASFGRGGGTGFLGSINGKSIFNVAKTADGQMRWDDIVRWNQGAVIADFTNNAGTAAPANATPGIATRNNGIVRRAHVNSHNWYGILTNFQHKINENWNFSAGFDGRYYYGYHPGVITDFLGNREYRENQNLNQQPYYTVTEAYKAKPSANPFVKAIKDDSQIASRNYDGEVLWYGVFGQVEYSKDKISAFIQGSASNQGFQRIDNWVVDGVTRQPNAVTGEVVQRKTGFKNILGYNAKGGVNYNIDEMHNVFANVGYYSRQPFLTAVYPNNQQVLNPNLTNEKIFSAELGYGFRSSDFKANVNLYRTSWADRFQRRTGLTIDPDNNPATNNSFLNAYAEVNGITEVHSGIEFEGFYKVGKFLELEGAVSIGDWKYTKDATSTAYDENNNPINLSSGSNVSTLALDGVKVGDAAQFTTSLVAIVKPIEGLRIFANWRYYDKLYAGFNVNDFDNSRNNATYTAPATEFGALELPDYHLFDLGASYRFNIKGGQSFTIGANVYNLFDTTYISESTSNVHANQSRRNFTSDAAYNSYVNAGQWNGVSQQNTVYFGFGRTWAANVTFTF
ncbi:TonB-dependent Receptor Plug Domain [Chryseobacterium takakiae]|uniref:TonB-dependent Receptor Plug Domain n=2 Tax=Chryseobacterium takakiae TaxID=1302685 RepID=A0A1M4VIS1_9FLAO|nr:TonB-dependent receptor plug domain-containing protein [Chryseobacterium takakiae]SHE68763.1 TonB-dependent Receptor Plug Domain [Chryseobacterium takakiae]